MCRNIEWKLSDIILHHILSYAIQNGSHKDDDLRKEALKSFDQYYIFCTILFYFKTQRMTFHRLKQLHDIFSQIDFVGRSLSIINCRQFIVLIQLKVAGECIGYQCTCRVYQQIVHSENNL